MKKQELSSYFEKEINNKKRFSLTKDEYTSIKNVRFLNINVHDHEKHYNLGMMKISGSLDSKKTQDMVKAHLDRFGLDLD
jgi:hypothetical protein